MLVNGQADSSVMTWCILGLLTLAVQEPQSAAAPQSPQPEYEIVELHPGKGRSGKSSSSRIVRTRHTASGSSKPIKIKAEKVNGIPKLKKPKKR